MRKNLTGKIFGRLVVVGPDGRQGREILWLCICNCFNAVSVKTGNLSSGNTKSCGCLSRENSKSLGKRTWRMNGIKAHTAKITHGHTRIEVGARTLTYRSWQAMKQRCTDPNASNYRSYGGKGIKVCERWFNSFQDFLADMGTRISVKHTLSRHNDRGNYEPGNVSWEIQ